MNQEECSKTSDPLSSPSSSWSTTTSPTWKINKTKRPRIIMGITGSVAAIKGPELIVQLHQQLHAQIVLVWTRSGEMFWNRSQEYHSSYWQQWEQFVSLHSHPNGTLQENLLENEDWHVKLYRHDDEWGVQKNQVSNEPKEANSSHSTHSSSSSSSFLPSPPSSWKKMGDPVLHIQLRNWADLILVAPLSAHTLAKIAHGFCDDLLSCIVRAWEFPFSWKDDKKEEEEEEDNENDSNGENSKKKGKPILLAPAMNTAMWNHPLTRQQLWTIWNFGRRERVEKNRNVPIQSCHDSRNGTLGSTKRNHCDHEDPKEEYSLQNFTQHESIVRIIEPQVKTLACGDVGRGGLADISKIISVVKECLY